MDENLLLAINQGWAHPWLDVLLGWVSQRAAFSFPMLGIILLLLWWGARAAGVKLWLVLILVIGLADFSGSLLKQAFSQPRPCQELTHVRLVQAPFPASCGRKPRGLPSNHAVNFAVTATFMGLVLRSLPWGISLGVITLLVMLSRVYLGVHYPSQVLFGAAWGIAVGVLAVVLARRTLRFVREFSWRSRLA